MLRSIVERVAFAAVSLWAMALIMAGLALVAAGLAVQPMGSDLAWVRVLSAGSLGLAVALVGAGGIAVYVARVTTRWLPDRPGSGASRGSGFDGWLIVLPLALIAVPTMLLVQLRPLLTFWRDVFMLADQLDIWQSLQGDMSGSGLVLLPVFAALALPSVNTLTAAAAVVGAVLTMALLLVRSARVPRALLLYVMLLGALGVASATGALVVERLAPAFEELVRSTPDPGGAELARVLAEFQRYRDVARGSALALSSSWVLLLVWPPLLILTADGRTAFSAGEGAGEPAPIDPAADERTRERAYRDAARRIDQSTQPSRWF